MKSTAIYKLRQKLAANEPVYGLWVTLESTSITEIAVALGLDWIVIDAEHSNLEWDGILEHIRAAAHSDTVVLVRVLALNNDLIRRALDLGADGIVVPPAESAKQLQEVVALAHSLPEGSRDIGVERANSVERRFGEQVEEPREKALVVPIIETIQEVRHLQEMLDVPGVEIFFFGPTDYLSTPDFPSQWQDESGAANISTAKDAIRSHGKHCGVVAASNDNLAQLREQGFHMLGIGFDTGLLIRSIHEVLSTIKSDSKPGVIFTLENGASTVAPVEPLSCVPESMRPDRPATMNSIGAGLKSEMASGVVFECLVGAHNNAHKLTTGIATFEPYSKLPNQSLPCSESITLLSGQAIVGVEGRIYTLEPLDNVTVPLGIAHFVSNSSSREPAVFHLSMPTEHPIRTRVWRFFSRKMMPADATGQGYPELITHHKTAPRYEAGPNTSFIDFFNRDLIEGIEMSGGYGLFHHQGRLPAHAHDFDESITIIQGAATCVVEGERYTLSDCATALQPRGRAHYFINEKQELMAMIWVYAGPLPERVVVDESCATVGVNPLRNSVDKQ